MKDIFISFELALWAKDLGFDEPCVGKYSGGSKELKVCIINQQMATWLLAPTYNQITNWFREEHKIVIELTCYETGWMTALSILPKVEKYIYKQMETEDYYEALNLGIIKALQSLEHSKKP